MTEDECAKTWHRVNVNGRCACGMWATLPATFVYCRCGRLIRPSDGDITTHPECETL